MLIGIAAAAALDSEIPPGAAVAMMGFDAAGNVLGEEYEFMPELGWMLEVPVAEGGCSLETSFTVSGLSVTGPLEVAGGEIVIVGPGENCPGTAVVGGGGTT